MSDLTEKAAALHTRAKGWGVRNPASWDDEAYAVSALIAAIPDLLAALTAKDEEIARLSETLERERIATTAAANRGWRCGP